MKSRHCVGMSLALFLGVLFAGCQPALGPHPLRAGGQFDSCEPDLRDSTVIACLKAQCCAETKACGTNGEKCSCALLCLEHWAQGNHMACAEACAAPEDHAMALCQANHHCGGGA